MLRLTVVASLSPWIVVLGVLYRNSSKGLTLGSAQICVKVNGDGESPLSANLSK
jgi:hypothetical protein